MNINELRRLGGTDLELPVLGFGAAPLGELFDVVTGPASQVVLEAAWHGGIRYYDTSPFYGHGKSEHRLGHFLQEQHRNDFVVSTKVGRVLTRGHGDLDGFSSEFWPRPLPFTLRFDYSYDGIMRCYEDSTHRLGLNRIDILFIHDLDYWFHETEEKVSAKLRELESGWKALDELRRSGEIHAVGAGINQEKMMPRLLENFDLDCFLVAAPYTLLDQDTLDREFPLCAERGVGVVVGTPYASGILATGAVPDAKYRYVDATAEILSRVERISAICDRHGIPLTAAAVQFPLAHPVVASVIPGALRAEHVQGTAASMATPIPPEFWSELKHEGLLREDAPVPA